MSTSEEMKNSAKNTQTEEVNSNISIGGLQNPRTSYIMDGEIFLKWSQFVQTYLNGKGRVSHILGKGPKPGEKGFDSWDEADSMVMSWLWDSMDPKISFTVMFLTTAKAIWDSSVEPTPRLETHPMFMK